MENENGELVSWLWDNDKYFDLALVHDAKNGNFIEAIEAARKIKLEDRIYNYSGECLDGDPDALPITDQEILDRYYEEDIHEQPEWYLVEVVSEDVIKDLVLKYGDAVIVKYISTSKGLNAMNKFTQEFEVHTNNIKEVMFDVCVDNIRQRLEKSLSWGI